MVRHVTIAAFIVLLTVSGCRRSAPDAQAGSPEAYAPGLGEIMTLQQMRHVKWWFAGEAGNWDLALYELKELQEGFDASAGSIRRTRNRPSHRATRFRG